MLKGPNTSDRHAQTADAVENNRRQAGLIEDSEIVEHAAEIVADSRYQTELPVGGSSIVIPAAVSVRSIEPHVLKFS